MMSKALYLLYVVIVVVVMLAVGRDTDNDRSWGRGGRTGWSAGAGHK